MSGGGSLHLQVSTCPTLHHDQDASSKQSNCLLLHNTSLRLLLVGEWMRVLILLQFQSLMVLGGCGPPSYWGRAFFCSCQLARGGFFRHHFAFPDRWNIDLRQTWDYCNISSHFDNSLFRLPGGLHSKCSERCQTNYGSDFLFHILQLWFQNLLALVTRYLESTFCPRFACIPGSLKCERGARAPGRPRHNMDHISTPQHALFSPPPPSSW